MLCVSASKDVFCEVQRALNDSGVSFWCVCGTMTARRRKLDEYFDRVPVVATLVGAEVVAQTPDAQVNPAQDSSMEAVNPVPTNHAIAKVVASASPLGDDEYLSVLQLLNAAKPAEMPFVLLKGGRKHFSRREHRWLQHSHER